MVNLNSFKLYVIRGNTDRTEGLGIQLDRETYADETVAYERLMTKDCAREWGVMGTPGGLELVVREYECDKDYRFLVKESVIWGYRKDWKGQWNYGFIDNRDAPTNDPEYTEYLRLKEKFGVN